MTEASHMPDVHEMIDDLTRSHTNRQAYEVDTGATKWTKGHVTTVPALVDQLLGAEPQSQGGSGAAGAFESRPAARIESIDTLWLIDHEAARWVRYLGEDDPGDKLDVTTGHHIPGSGTIACLTKLHALRAGLRQCDRHAGKHDSGVWCCTVHHIDHDVRRWWRQARIISGWDSPAWRPDNTCIFCEQRRSLRVNVLMQTAFCVECRMDWGPDEIGLLAEHIRAENGEDGQELGPGDLEKAS